MSTALFVNTYSREIQVSAVSVTEVTESDARRYEAIEHSSGVLEVAQMPRRKGLVLRFGATIGNLWQLTTDNGEFRPELPVIVAVRGYSAKSSAGFVDVVKDIHGGYRQGHPTRVHTYVLGIQGFPWQTHKSLRVLGDPMEVFVLRPETTMRQVETHARRKPGTGWHSNRDTAGAARTAIELRAKARPESIFVVEGQSDYAQAWELVAPYNTYDEEFVPEFPEEFRTDRFTDEALIAAALRTAARKNAPNYEEGGMEGVYFAYTNLILADVRTWGEKLFPWYTRQLVGERLADIVRELADNMRAEGWKLAVDMTVANRFLNALDPEGKVVASGWGAVHGPKEYAAKLYEFADGNSEEERTKLLQELEEQDDNSRAWLNHIGA